MDKVIDLLRERGFEVAGVDESYSKKPRGTVISQRPSGGRLPWGSAIALVTSKGPKPVGVPAVDGLAVKSARARLGRAGLDVSIERNYSEEVPDGRVIESAPAPGDVVPGGSTVTVSVSRGPRRPSRRD